MFLAVLVSWANEFNGCNQCWPCLGTKDEDERNLFESSYAARLNRGMGLYFGL